jgi:hypothetical protein
MERAAPSEKSSLRAKLSNNGPWTAGSQCQGSWHIGWRCGKPRFFGAPLIHLTWDEGTVTYVPDSVWSNPELGVVERRSPQRYVHHITNKSLSMLQRLFIGDTQSDFIPLATLQHIRRHTVVPRRRNLPIKR